MGAAERRKAEPKRADERTLIGSREPYSSGRRAAKGAIAHQNGRQEASDVAAVFGAEALPIFISECNEQEHIGITKPSDFVGKLFETKWDSNSLKAIRIHPSYGTKRTWFKVGIAVGDKERTDLIRGWLEYRDGDDDA